MHSVHIQHLGETHSHTALVSSIQKDDNNALICLIHTPHSTVSHMIHGYCSDLFSSYEIHGESMAHCFTEILEDINGYLASVYTTHKKHEVSMFVGLASENILHFSMFGSHLTGILTSTKNVEDIFQGMDSHEGIFVYDSHGEIHSGESIYLFAPRIDTHLIDQECRTLKHLSIEEQTRLIAERLERTHHTDGVIVAISREGDEQGHEWTPEQLPTRRSGALSHLQQALNRSTKRGMSYFQRLGQKTQNSLLITGLLISIILLYLVLSGLMKSQYSVFVPQKYRDMLAEARVNLDTAARSLEQPDQFALAINKSKQLVQDVKNAHVLDVNVDQIEKDIALLEKSINKVITLRPEQVKPLYTFENQVAPLPFSLYSQDQKLFLVTENSIIGPVISGELPKKVTIPDGELTTHSDMDNDGRIYLSTSKDKIYLYDKGTINSLNVQQVGGWDKTSDLSVYNGNIYLLSADRKQIYKHRRQTENTYTGKTLVITPETQTNAIINFDIDGSIWILSGTNTLSAEKILTAPRYERRTITVNNLGINTFTNLDPAVTKIYADPAFQEVYFLVDNRIWVFAPNSKRFSDVKSMNYLGQIDAPNIAITDLTVQQSGDTREIFFGSPKSGIFSTKFTVKENKLHILGN